MSGIVFALAAYGLSGTAAVIDKILLTRRIPSAPAYAFFVGVLGIFALLLAPFGFRFLPPFTTAVSLTSGALFIFALLLMYEAIQRAEVSRVAPIIGAFTPALIIGFSWLGYGAPISTPQYIAAGLFIAGGLLLVPHKEDARPQAPTIVFSVAASALLALSFLLLDNAFRSAPFIPAFIWSRLGSVGVSLFFLFIPSVRRAIAQTTHTSTQTSAVLFFFNKGVGALSFFLLNYAIALGPLAVVSALKGAEYAAVFVGAVILSRYVPRVLQERMDAKTLALKGGGIAIIAVGFILLART